MQHNHAVLIAHLPFPSPATLDNIQVEHRARQARLCDFRFEPKAGAVAGLLLPSNLSFMALDTS